MLDNTNASMRWFGIQSSEEDVMRELRTKFGLGKRTVQVEIQPELPYKRPLTPAETRIMREYFDANFKWTDIDAKGRILLIGLGSSVQLSKHYVTEEDLKIEINRRKQ